MPTYEYQCRNCEHHLEVFQKITDEPLLNCPKCQQAALGKVLSASNFHLKGSGWYVTDIRDKDKPKPASADKPAETSEAKSTDTSSDSKTTDTTSTTKPAE